jgi:hypothetical protein
MKLVGAADLLPGPRPAIRVLMRSSRRHGEAPNGTACGTCLHGRRHRGPERHRTLRCGVLRPRGCRCRAGRPGRRADRAGGPPVHRRRRAPAHPS